LIIDYIFFISFSHFDDAAIIAIFDTPHFITCHY